MREPNFWGSNFLELKFLGTQISWGPYFSGTKFLVDPKKYGAQMRSGTISID